MKKTSIFSLTVFAFSLMSALPVGAESLSGLPPVVSQHILNMHKACAQMGGKPGQGDDNIDQVNSYPYKIVEHVFLGKNRVETWIVDEGRYECEGNFSIFSGASGNADIYFFTKQKNGRVKEVANINAHGFEIENDGQVTTIWLNVGGGWCGGPNFESKACAIGCLRPLTWNEKSQKLEFAPLYQAKNFSIPCPKNN